MAESTAVRAAELSLLEHDTSADRFTTERTLQIWSVRAVWQCNAVGRFAMFYSYRRFSGRTPGRAGRSSLLQLEALESRRVLATTFTVEPPVTHATVNGASNVQAGDLDGDGDPDVVSASAVDNRIAWYENLDDKADFGAQRLITDQAFGVRSLEVVDLDGDSDLDIVAAHYDGNAIVWYENQDGRGNFASANAIDADLLGPIRVVVEDLDGDGDLDVLSTALDSGQVVWYENRDGAATFGSVNVIAADLPLLGYATAKDVDGDGPAEVLVSLDAKADLRIFGWQRDEFQETQAVESGMEIQAGHFVDNDGDGDLDFYAAGELSSWVQVFGQQQGRFMSTGRFSLSSLPDSREVWGAGDMEYVDIDGDGQEEFVTASAYGGIAAWHSRNGAVLITDEIELVSDIETADLDGDGDLDVLSASFHDDKVAWYQNDGTGQFGPQQLLTDAGLANASLVRSLDVDGDGDLDLVSSDRLDQKIVWYDNLDGNGAFGPEQTLFQQRDEPNRPGQFTVEAPWILEALDYDLDGRTDLVGAAWTTELFDNRPGASVYGWRNGDDQFELFRPTNEFTFTRVTLPGDIDGDGDPDLLSTGVGSIDNRFGDQLVWHENLGNGQPDVRHVIETSVFEEASSFDLVDMDRDGDTDVLAALVHFDPETESDTRVVWYENQDGAGTFSAARLITAEASGVRSVHADDVDGDGDPDVTMSVIYESGIIWYENRDGRGQFDRNARVVTDSIDLVRVLHPSDLDADGDMDLIAVSAFDDSVSWYENTNGRGLFGPRIVITDEADGAWDAITVDLDGDGDLDVASASRNDGKIAWYRNDLDAVTTPGDFNRDQVRDVEDLDLFCKAFRSQSDAPIFDIDGDGQLTSFDRQQLVREVFGSAYGDANLDGVFNSSDLVLVFQAGEYEDGQPLNSSWATGDWDCDGDFGTSDLVLSFQAFQPQGVRADSSSIAAALAPRHRSATSEDQPDSLAQHEEGQADGANRARQLDLRTRDLVFAQDRIQELNDQRSEAKQLEAGRELWTKLGTLND